MANFDKVICVFVIAFCFISAVVCEDATDVQGT